MRRRHFAILVASAAATLCAPAAAQFGPAYNAVEFLSAVRNRDGDKANSLIGDSQSNVIVNARGDDGNTPLIITISRRDPEWTGFLLNKGADPNLPGRGGDTPLIVASRLGFDEAIEWLLSLGAKVDATNRMGETALIAAVQQRQTPAVRLLLAAGADPDKTDTAAGYSARQYAERDNRARDILQLIQAKRPKPAAK